MRKFNILLFLTLLVVPKFFYGQKLISCRIMDEATKQAIPYANIWIKDVNLGTTSNENGDFTLKIENSQASSQLVITSIGYKDSLVQINTIKSEIKLKPKVYQLSEVKVTPRKVKWIILNDLSKSKIEGGIMNDTTPVIYGRYFPFEQKNSAYQYLKTIIIFTRDIHRGKFNLRLYSFDSTKVVPIDNLVHENIIVETKLSIFAQPRKVEIDVSKYKIIFPKSGLLVGVEWLVIPQNRYEETTTYKDNSKPKEVRTMYLPDLAATMDKNGYVYHYSKGKWRKPGSTPVIPAYKYSGTFFNPAISVKLTD